MGTLCTPSNSPIGILVFSYFGINGSRVEVGSGSGGYT